MQRSEKNRGIHMIMAGNKLDFQPLGQLTPAYVTCVRCQTDQPPNSDTAKSGASDNFPPATLRSGASNRMLALERAGRLVDTTADNTLRMKNVSHSIFMGGNYTRHPFTVRNPSLCPQDIPVYFFGHHNK
jgi:hypothetical protein